MGWDFKELLLEVDHPIFDVVTVSFSHLFQVDVLFWVVELVPTIFLTVGPKRCL
jgi:hypothetical protein